ncbi:MAG TPA: hypothetical protein VJ672_09025 [Gemmatimonadaceae bacterium]|nr:hypothetical protein [Gemmatimonadaceae bacterium]
MIGGVPAIGVCSEPTAVLGRRRHLIALLLFIAPIVVACGDRAEASSKSTAAHTATPSLEAGLAQFRRDLPVAVELRGGETSREALVRRFLTAVARNDTNDVRAMLMSRSEFAYLYYPTSPFATRQQAGLWWFLNIENSRTGITRAFARLAAQPLRYVGHECAASVPDGKSFTHDHCQVTFAVGRDTTTLRLFGSILEHGGRYKFMGYGNDF